MARSARHLVVTVVLAVSAILFVPAFIDAKNALSYDATRFNGYLEPVFSHFELLIVLFALVMLATFILDT